MVEELVEGGLTRLAVFFYSQVPDNAGPVRSMRASDIGIVPRRPRLRRDQRRGRGHHPADHRRRHPVHPGGRPRHLPRHRALGAVQPLRPPRRDGQVLQAAGRPAGRLPALGRRQRPAAGQEGHDVRGGLLGRARDRVEVRRRALRQRQLQRRSRRPVPGRHRAHPAGARSATPATSTRRATTCPRPSSSARAGVAVPRRPGDPGDLAQGQADLDAQPGVQGRDAHRARRPRLDRAGPGRAPATSPGRSSGASRRTAAYAAHWAHGRPPRRAAAGGDAAAARPELRRDRRAAPRRRRERRAGRGAQPSLDGAGRRGAGVVGRRRRRARSALPGRSGLDRGCPRRGPAAVRRRRAGRLPRGHRRPRRDRPRHPRRARRRQPRRDCGSTPGTPAGAPASSRARSRRAAGTSSPRYRPTASATTPSASGATSCVASPASSPGTPPGPLDPDLN